MITDVGFYLRVMVRRLPAMVLLLLIASTAGVIMSQRLPTLYKTSAKLLVESAQISDDLVRSAVRVGTGEQLEVIQQRMLTRANLIDIANRVRPFPDMVSMSSDEIVSAMRRGTSIRRTSGREKATLMTIGFEGRDPRKVTQVVNEYVNIVLATNADFRSQRSEGPVSFFEQEVQTLSENLDAQSAKIVAFKNANADALPENLDYRLARQSRLQERLSRGERDLETLQAQRTSIEKFFENSGELPVNPATQTPEQKELAALESQMRVALSVYSETNPKVKSLRARIDTLSAQIDENAALGADQAGQPGQMSPATRLDLSLAELDTRVTALQSEIEDATTELKALEDSIERTPVNGITLDAMTRDQLNIQTLYSAAVTRLAQARMSERIELSSKGERITVLEAASVPNKPSGPNRPKVAAMGVAVGLGLAAGLFVLLELMNQAIRRPADIVKAIEITPLATLPRIETLARQRWQRFALLATLAAVLIGVPAILWALDSYYMPLDLLFEKIKNRLV